LQNSIRKHLPHDLNFIKQIKNHFMKHSTLSLLIAASLLMSCNKPELSVAGSGNAASNPGSIYTAPPGTPSGGTGQYGLPTNPPSNSILVDASKDGGVWWFPQGPGTGYSSTAHHQGKALADYLRSKGYIVDELPRGAVITTELLNKYNKVIRAAAFYSYTTQEIEAYQSFLSKQSSLFLTSDHLQNTVNDGLSAYLGLMFEGSQWGPITSFQSHPVTMGVSSVNFIAGSVIRNWDPSKITVLGSINIQSGGGEGTMVGAMGIVKHPSSKIFFIGDLNGIEQVPQPFTSNIVTWLFQ
jgi:hypothetical protein